MDVTDLRIALFSGNYNYTRDGCNQALNRLAASVDKAQDYFDAELGLCRLDPDFSAFYGQRIYVCKRLVAA